MTRIGMCLALLALTSAAVTSAARAHFLFVKVGPMAEGGRSAEVYFSEQAEAGDPKFVKKIAGTRLWLQTRPGVLEPLPVSKAADRLSAPVPPGGSMSVVGVCEYGVLARPKETPFLLRYYPKAVAGRPEVVNALSPSKLAEIPLEIMGTFESGRVKLAVYRNSQPMPKAVFHTVDSDLNNSEVTAGEDGFATWTPPKTGQYSIYVKDIVNQGGSHNGQRYDEVREFATLAFSWPLDRHDADPEAIVMFEKAIATRATWPGFPGFTASAAGVVDGRAFNGKVAVSSTGEVKVDVDDAVARPWLEDQLASIAMHRLPENARGASAEKPVLRFADDEEDNPLGRLLAFEGGRFASSYRVKDDQIVTVNRHIGRQTMTIRVLDNTPNGEGKFLPHNYLVQYWDAVTGRLNRVETVEERWTRVGKWDLPARHTLSTASDSGLATRSVTLTGHKLAD